MSILDSAREAVRRDPEDETDRLRRKNTFERFLVDRLGADAADLARITEIGTGVRSSFMLSVPPIVLYSVYMGNGYVGASVACSVCGGIAGLPISIASLQRLGTFIAEARPAACKACEKTVRQRQFLENQGITLKGGAV